jgi:hypothetical protein
MWEDIGVRTSSSLPVSQSRDLCGDEAAGGTPLDDTEAVGLVIVGLVSSLLLLA